MRLATHDIVAPVKVHDARKSGMKIPKQNATRSNRQKAFTLPEVLVAVMIVGVMFVGLYAGISQGMSIINSARYNLRATQIMADTMEVIRMYSWEQVNSNGFVPSSVTVDFFPTPGSTNISGNLGTAYINIQNAGMNQNYSTNMKKVTITLQWTNSSGEQTRTMSSYITRNGLQNYVY